MTLLGFRSFNISFHLFSFATRLFIWHVDYFVWAEGLNLEWKSLTGARHQWNNEAHFLHPCLKKPQIRILIRNKYIILRDWFKTTLGAHVYHYINMKPTDKQQIQEIRLLIQSRIFLAPVWHQMETMEHFQNI